MFRLRYVYEPFTATNVLPHLALLTLKHLLSPPSPHCPPGRFLRAKNRRTRRAHPTTPPKPGFRLHPCPKVSVRRATERPRAVSIGRRSRSAQAPLTGQARHSHPRQSPRTPPVRPELRASGSTVP